MRATALIYTLNMNNPVGVMNSARVRHTCTGASNRKARGGAPEAYMSF